MINKQKILIVFYSKAGNNYVKGKIVNLSVGNTKVIAEKLQQLTEGQLYEIKTLKDYPEDYNETTKVALEELKMRTRPELLNLPEDLHEFDTIFLGFPNWWGTMPMAVYTFLEAFQWQGKRIIPFCTHGGSGMSNCISDIKKTCPKAYVDPGIAIYGHEAQFSEKILKKWLQEIEL